MYSYKTKGTCSREIQFDVENNIVKEIRFIGGCMGNTQGVAALCKGRNIDEIISMKKGLKATYKKIGIMKYDTFRGMAGKLSFSLALLDGDDSGFVLSSMHTQDGCYSYLKEIIHGQSHATLSNEERDALEMALNYNVDAAKLEEKQAQQATPVQQDTDETSTN